MGLRQTVTVRGRRSLVVAACLGLVAAGALARSKPLAFGSSPRSGLADARFDPRSVTFVSPHTGWVLGTVPCAPAGACVALAQTTDAGRSWFARPLPASLVAAADRKVGGVPADLYDSASVGLNVRFADPRDGWIYGGLAVPTHPASSAAAAIEATLWSTHDGGLTWHQQPLRGLGSQASIFDLEAAAGTAHLMESSTAGGVSVKSSLATHDRWSVSNAVRLGSPAGGGQQTGAFIFQGSSGWLVEGNDRGTTGSARIAHGRWVSWTPPCASVGHSFAIPAASTANNLVAVCVMGGFAYPLSKSAPPGATLGSSWLYFSTDAGRTFDAGPELRPHAFTFFGVLASPSPRTILLGHGVGSAQELVASFDGGLHWTDVYRGTPLFLGFTTPRQGVAIIGSSKSTAMIMTFDGGHHWTRVTF